jgi:enoyl-CoA hydratase/carnithine racemase
VAAADAKLGLPEIRHGLLPGAGGTQRMTRLAGAGVAARMMLTGDVVSGVEAERLGIVEWAVPSADVEATALGLAARMGAEPLAAAAVKECIRLAAQTGDAGFERELSASRELYATDSVQQRLAAF